MPDIHIQQDSLHPAHQRRANPGCGWVARYFIENKPPQLQRTGELRPEVVCADPSDHFPAALRMNRKQVFDQVVVGPRRQGEAHVGRGLAVRAAAEDHEMVGSLPLDFVTFRLVQIDDGIRVQRRGKVAQRRRLTRSGVANELDYGDGPLGGQRLDDLIQRNSIACLRRDNSGPDWGLKWMDHVRSHPHTAAAAARVGRPARATPTPCCSGPPRASTSERPSTFAISSNVHERDVAAKVVLR